MAPDGLLLPGATAPSTLRGMQRESASASLRWHNIFNAHLTVRRRSDPSDRQMVYARVSRVSPHGKHNLPHALRWARHVLALAQSHQRGRRLRLGPVGYVRVGSSVPQAWHRDVPRNHAGVALSAFTPVNVACPPDDPAASLWFPPRGGSPRPMGSDPGDVFILDSRTVHRGGGRPCSAPPTQPYRIVAFAAIVEAGRPAPDYDHTVPVRIGGNKKRTHKQ
jgi:hypothetical protein